MSEETQGKETMSFSDMLEILIEDINWKVAYNGDERRIFAKHQTGFYEELTKDATRMKVRAKFKLATPSTVNALSMALCEDEERIIDLESFRKSRERIVGFQDACFDLTTGKFRKYTSTDFCLNPLPHRMNYADYSAEADSWFQGVLASWVGQDCADWFANVLAYFLFVHPNEEQVWLNLFGMGSNGKSLCLKILERILGTEKVIGCDLANINRFSTASFIGKWLVIGRDSSTYVSDGATALIKAYTGEERGLIERKGGLSFDDSIDGKMIVSTNTLIHSKDRSFGWFRRILPVPFPYQFAKDRSFEKSLMVRLPEIIRALLHRAYCYTINTTSFKSNLPKVVSDLITETRYTNDRVSHYWESEFFDANEKTGAKKENLAKMREFDGWGMSSIYADYCEWHERHYGDGQPEPSLKTFGGQYGAFLTLAKDYYKWNRSREGSTVELVERFRKQPGEDG